MCDEVCELLFQLQTAGTKLNPLDWDVCAELNGFLRLQAHQVNAGAACLQAANANWSDGESQSRRERVQRRSHAGASLCQEKEAASSTLAWTWTRTEAEQRNGWRCESCFELAASSSALASCFQARRFHRSLLKTRTGAGPYAAKS